MIKQRNNIKPLKYRRQSGHAAMLFVMIIPILFGVFVLGMDGARALQNKARLDEATEVIALAMSGQNTTTEASRNEIVQNYIGYFFPQATLDEVTTQVIACDDNPNCDLSSLASEQFFEYDIQLRITEPSWFPNKGISNGFGESYDVASSSSVRKYNSKSVDVILVSDFSGSMADSVSSGRDAKYVELQDIISTVSSTLQEYNDNTGTNSQIAFVGFDGFVFPGTSYSYQSCNRWYCTTHQAYYAYSYLMCNSDTTKNGYTQVKESGWCYNDAFSVDYTLTINSVFDESAHVETGATTSMTFYTLPLTNDFSTFVSTINNFSPAGITAFYSGLIRGAQVAADGDNSRRLIIILSDGMNSYSDITNNLVDNGLCSFITEGLNAMTTSEDEDVKSRLFAIGFGYTISNYPEMKNCVGEQNVFDATDKDSIKNKILELVADEMGRLAPTQLTPADE